MNSKCETVIISDKAYNAIIRESFAKHPVETGGILLGYILDNGLWVVMEMIPPGMNGIFQPAYFEHDQDFVNYLANSVANQYKKPLQVLGLWHRHPGSMDYFSSTDDGTNSEFASLNPYGVISGLVNIDPAFRLTMYHLDHNDGVRPRNIAYSTVDVEVGDDLIPEKFFALRYVDEERSELHPIPTHTNTRVSQTRSVPKTPRNGGDEIAEQKMPEVPQQPSAPSITSVNSPKKPESRKWLLPTIAAIIFLVGAFVGIKAAPLFNSSATTETEHVSGDAGSNGGAVNKDKGNKKDTHTGTNTPVNGNSDANNHDRANPETTTLNNGNNGSNRSE